MDDVEDMLEMENDSSLLSPEGFLYTEETQDTGSVGVVEVPEVPVPVKNTVPWWWWGAPLIVVGLVGVGLGLFFLLRHASHHTALGPVQPAKPGVPGTAPSDGSGNAGTSDKHPLPSNSSGFPPADTDPPGTPSVPPSHPQGDPGLHPDTNFTITLPVVPEAFRDHPENLGATEVADAKTLAALQLKPMYEPATVLTQSRTFVVPAGMTHMRVLLIGGGGAGGFGGEGGEGAAAGQLVNLSSDKYQATGGGGGAGGWGGGGGGGGSGELVFGAVVVKGGDVLHCEVGVGGTVDAQTGIPSSGTVSRIRLNSSQNLLFQARPGEAGSSGGKAGPGGAGLSGHVTSPWNSANDTTSSGGGGGSGGLGGTGGDGGNSPFQGGGAAPGGCGGGGGGAGAARMDHKNVPFSVRLGALGAPGRAGRAGICGLASVQAPGVPKSNQVAYFSESGTGPDSDGVFTGGDGGECPESDVDSVRAPGGLGGRTPWAHYGNGGQGGSGAPGKSGDSARNSVRAEGDTIGNLIQPFEERLGKPGDPGVIVLSFSTTE